MLEQIDFGFNDGREYCIFYDSDHMTEEQARAECEFVGWGKGCDESLYPYYIIVPKAKKPILSCIKEHCVDLGYNMATDFYWEENYK
jgi:hypothetical protein